MATENLFHSVIKGNDWTEISVFTTHVAELYAEISTKFIHSTKKLVKSLELFGTVTSLLIIFLSVKVDFQKSRSTADKGDGRRGRLIFLVSFAAQLKTS